MLPNHIIGFDWYGFTYHLLLFAYLFSMLSGFGTAVDIVYGCLNELEECHDRSQRHAYVLKKVRECCKELNRLDSRGNCLFVYMFIYYHFLLVLGKPRPICL